MTTDRIAEKALSVKQPWASLIASGEKTIEVRSRRTKFRGRVLICVSKRPVMDGLPAGVAICTVELVDCRPLEPADERLSGVGHMDDQWAWILRDARPVEHFAVSGQLGLFPCPSPEEGAALAPGGALLFQ